jgi:hypothetical protein
MLLFCLILAKHILLGFYLLGAEPFESHNVICFEPELSFGLRRYRRMSTDAESAYYPFTSFSPFSGFNFQCLAVAKYIV